MKKIKDMYMWELEAVTSGYNGSQDRFEIVIDKPHRELVVYNVENWDNSADDYFMFFNIDTLDKTMPEFIAYFSD